MKRLALMSVEPLPRYSLEEGSPPLEAFRYDSVVA